MGEGWSIRERLECRACTLGAKEKDSLKVFKFYVLIVIARKVSLENAHTKAIMNNLTLKARLVRWFQNRPTEVWPKGEMERMVAATTTYTPDNCGRRLRELAEEGILKVEMKKGHAHYSWNDSQIDWAHEEALFNSLPDGNK